MTPSPSKSNPIPISWVESLFSKFSAMYGNRFLDMWRGVDMDEVRQLWANELGKLTVDQLKTGVKGLMGREFPPSLPEFIKLCRPAIDPVAAYYEAVEGVAMRSRGEKGRWSHPAIFWASVAVSAHDLKNATYYQIRERWGNALQAEIEKGQWADIPEPALSLPAPATQAADPAAAAKVMEQVHQAVNPTRTDHKRWAKKIIERVKQGDKNVPPIAVQMAKDALAEGAYEH